MGTKKGCSPVVYIAFALTFLSSVEAQCSESGIALAGSSGSFRSQDYPSNYPNDLTCTWIITVPQGHVVRLSF
ncbi:procollagen C-endopeptidase enhancer 2-like [Oculina patagonica]